MMGTTGGARRNDRPRAPRDESVQQPASGRPGSPVAGRLLHLQGSAGNTAVTWLLRAPDLTAAAPSVAIGPFPHLETTAQLGNALLYVALDTRQSVAGYDRADPD